MNCECPICGKKLCSEQEVEIHIRIHIHTDDHTPIASNIYNQENGMGMHNSNTQHVLDTIIQHNSFDSFSSAIEISVSMKYISLVCDIFINNCITIL